ncbi:hypothetical protein C7E12_00015 [Stenotrophomonas maltophilia]|nr:hypothetical protein C7E12_00015 [Stenotrophomonas maltophilia]
MCLRSFAEPNQFRYHQIVKKITSNGGEDMNAIDRDILIVGLFIASFAVFFVGWACWLAARRRPCRRSERKV